MTEKPQTSEEVADSLQYGVINHLKRVYIKRSSGAQSQMIADCDLKETLELVCDFLPPRLQSQIREILALHAFLGKSSIDRYYVQTLSDTHFVVRERGTDRVEPLPSDRIVRDEFSARPDAVCYTRAMNELQRKLDLEYGRWTKHAVGSTQTEETKDE